MSADSTIVAMIDHTLLRADAMPGEIDRLCEEALEWGFAAVCVNPYWVPRVAERLSGSAVKVATVVGFPLGANATAVKAFEARAAVEQGAEEIDMVLNVCELRAGNLEAVRSDIAAVVEAAHGGGAIVKVILETALLTDGEKRTACRIAQEAGTEFVKTSTGFAEGGATVGDVALMRNAVTRGADAHHDAHDSVGPARRPVGNTVESAAKSMGVKASGGIRTLADARAMVQAGANRIGTSAGVKIGREEQAEREAPVK